ncbi:tryptophanyl-tRNA synthetase [Gammaproteobacteria bacterium]|nr:tryptophan--tRNA ligase [Gammaproteobacteria bacterium]CAG0941023.1 tryptophanyl-tRNA synthetase [Gammaproteobacteria bacterium]
MQKEIVLTGITTTGTPHLGNYVGAIRPAVAASRRDDVQSVYFLADLHALVKAQQPDAVHRSSLEVAATWLALGLDADRALFYRQSDVPEIAELNWILMSVTAKGLMNRAHAYKAAVQANEEAGSPDPDRGITMALFCYPVLMAADILLFRASRVPVGQDQKQHVEMARDIAQRFNHHYGEHFVLPEADIGAGTAILQGLDGRKMSKSYDNTIPLFAQQKQLRKLVMRIRTNSLEPGQPKDTEGSTLFDIYRAFATPAETEAMKRRFAEGAGWGQLKEELFAYLDAHLAGPRAEYERLVAAPGDVEAILRAGAGRARAMAAPLLSAVRRAVGIRPLGVPVP